MDLDRLFSVAGRRVAITGAGGVLCGSLARGLAALGAAIAVIDIDRAKAQRVADDIVASGGEALALACDVTDGPAVRGTADAMVQRWGRVDALINGAGGNHPQATTSAEQTFFDLPLPAFRQVCDLNFQGTLLPCQAFGRLMADQGEGCIINIASMNSLRPLTRIPAYSAAKAAVANLTQWLAVHMAQEYDPRIRVNALAPGFFVTEQTRYLHIDRETGDYTPRGRRIVEHTPAGRMGRPEDLLSTVVWLMGPGAAFVTGVVVPVDGGFSAYSGV